MIFKREIERKFVVVGQSYEEVYMFLTTVGEIKVNASSFDTYWRARGVDFVRLRDNSREITVKVTDKHTVVDRIEENVHVEKESMGAASRLLTLLLGPPSMKITKKFSVFTITTSPAPGTEFRAVLCLYQVRGDVSNRVFFEVEAESLPIVDHILKDVIQSNLTLKVENRSLFQIFEKEAA